MLCFIYMCTLTVLCFAWAQRMLAVLCKKNEFGLFISSDLEAGSPAWIELLQRLWLDGNDVNLLVRTKQRNDSLLKSVLGFYGIDARQVSKLKVSALEKLTCTVHSILNIAPVAKDS